MTAHLFALTSLKFAKLYVNLICFSSGRGGGDLSQEMVVCQALWLKSVVAVNDGRFSQASELLTRCLHVVHHLLSVIDNSDPLLPLVMKMRVSTWLVLHVGKLSLLRANI